ncbi:RiPP maturation radical SAM C-methyltransferase [Kibdelosporangium persicum]
MPFTHVDRPSIQLGLLRAIGEANGFPVRTVHANLDFAARIGIEYYRALADMRGRMIGDWLFSVEAFGADAPDPDALLPGEFEPELSYLAGGGPVRDRLLRTRDRDVPAFLDDLADGIDWSDVDVVGFSCTFQQNTASFALARRIRQRRPDIVTVFGGAGFDGEMGLEFARSVECVDYVVIGEGDTAFPRLLKALSEGANPLTVPGVASRDGMTPAEPPIEALDELPVPNYDEYFERAANLGLLPDVVWLPIESARGCWWGAKHHCTFCGLNGTTMRFRAKSPNRVLAELAGQARRYGAFQFEAVDNIMDPRYVRELLPAVVEDGSDYEFFYEVKANLSRAHLKLLAQAGVTRLQPGLESLSSHVLRLMDKGVRAAQNVNLLRWARYYGIEVGWNILWGFPGETTADYAQQAAVIPHLVHLQPPEGAARVWLERFSPMYTRMRMRHRAPERSYQYVYPKTVDLDRIAYFFDYEMEDALPDETYADLAREVAAWTGLWESRHRPVLTYWSSPGYLRIYDGRHEGREGTYTFRDTLARIYLACGDRPTTARAVQDKLGPDVPVRAIEDAFAQFAERGLMFLDESLALALALPATRGR